MSLPLYIIGAVFIVACLWLMRYALRSLRDEPYYWTSHGRKIPPRHPNRRKRGL